MHSVVISHFSTEAPPTIIFEMLITAQRNQVPHKYKIIEPDNGVRIRYSMIQFAQHAPVKRVFRFFPFPTEILDIGNSSCQ